MAEATWIKHSSGVFYRRGRLNGSHSLSLLSIAATYNHSGELRYQIQGTNEWIDEEDFVRHCDVKAR
jgi:hypothetical protein